MQAGGCDPFCALCQFVLGYTLSFTSLNFILLSTSVLWDCGGIQWMCLYLSPQTYPLRYGIWLLPCCRFCLSGHVLFGQNQILCQWPCTTFLLMSCHSELHAEYKSFTSSLILFSSSFLSRSTSTPRVCFSCNKAQVYCDFLFLILLCLQMKYSTNRVFIFRVLGYLHPLVLPSQIH